MDGTIYKPNEASYFINYNKQFHAKIRNVFSMTFYQNTPTYVFKNNKIPISLGWGVNNYFLKII